MNFTILVIFILTIAFVETLNNQLYLLSMLLFFLTVTFMSIQIEMFEQINNKTQIVIKFNNKHHKLELINEHYEHYKQYLIDSLIKENKNE